MALAFVALLLAQPVLAQTGSLENRVKAAFIFNFTRFVDWPPGTFASADAPLEICVAAGNAMNSTLEETVRGKSVNRHPLAIRQVRGGDLRGCKVVYFGNLGQDQLRDWLGELHGAAVLTVSDSPGFIDAGGMIRFLIVDGKVRFEINQRATERARLTVSSQLLNVAHTVVRGPGG